MVFVFIGFFSQVRSTVASNRHCVMFPFRINLYKLFIRYLSFFNLSSFKPIY